MTEVPTQEMRTRFMGDLAIISLALRQYRAEAPDAVDQAMWLLVGLLRASLQSDDVPMGLYRLAAAPDLRGMN
jgi:hypothetical protein